MAAFAGLAVEAFLFDMDGTILNSAIPGERVWAAWATRQCLDVEAFLPTIHGIRSVETIRRLGLPGIDPEAEAAAITAAEIADVNGIAEIAGAGAFLRALPPDRWAVVTSAPKALALRRIEAAGLPLPAVMVTAEDVTHGKPAPECFLLGAQRLGVAIARCAVVEDSAAGIAAGEAAGATVWVITATHRHAMTTPHPATATYQGLVPVANADGTVRVAAASL